MKVSKYYIIYIENKISKEYVGHTQESCRKLGLKYELFKGYMPNSQKDLWRNFKNTAGIEVKNYKHMAKGAAGCTTSHAHLWKKIYDNRECAVILEHDAMMLWPMTIDIPDGKIVSLGHKYRNWDKYDYQTAGPPQTHYDVSCAPGSHAYAITWKTAEKLVQDIEKEGITEAIDNRHFMHTRKNWTEVPIAMTDPIAAMGWLRESTIQSYSATHNHVPEMAKSFTDNFDSPLRENVVVQRRPKSINNKTA